MIKLERGACPKELTGEVCEELTRMYKENKERDVWNSPNIKKSLKAALLDMSHKKCVYCECELNIESKDVTIDHFLPKSTNPDKVVQWTNLLPPCLRCNRAKGDYEGRIVNPFEDIPKEYIALSVQNRYRLEGIDITGIGKNTIVSINLNDIQRVMVPRMAEWEEIHQRLVDISEDLNEYGYKERYRKRLEILMGKCTADNPYAAVKASNMLEDRCYLSIKKSMKENGKWTYRLEEVENEMKQIALQFV